jgi:hypothetical protein
MDRFTVAVLEEHLDRLAGEIATAGKRYQDHGLAFCWEDGQPVYPDTVTERFNRLVDLAKVPKITLHEVRHSCPTIALRTGVHSKVVSGRLGHATVVFTLDTYSADMPELDESAAESISGLLAPGRGESQMINIGLLSPTGHFWDPVRGHPAAPEPAGQAWRALAQRTRHPAR